MQSNNIFKRKKWVTGLGGLFLIATAIGSGSQGFAGDSPGGRSSIADLSQWAKQVEQLNLSNDNIIYEGGEDGQGYVCVIDSAFSKKCYERFLDLKDPQDPSYDSANENRYEISLGNENKQTAGNKKSMDRYYIDELAKSERPSYSRLANSRESDNIDWNQEIKLYSQFLLKDFGVQWQQGQRIRSTSAEVSSFRADGGSRGSAEIVEANSVIYEFPFFLRFQFHKNSIEQGTQFIQGVLNVTFQEGTIVELKVKSYSYSRWLERAGRYAKYFGSILTGNIGSKSEYLGKDHERNIQRIQALVLPVMKMSLDGNPYFEKRLEQAVQEQLFNDSLNCKGQKGAVTGSSLRGSSVDSGSCDYLPPAD